MIEGEAHYAALLASVLDIDGLVVVVDEHLWAVECPLFGYNKVSGCFEKLYCIVNQGRQRNREFSSEKIRSVSIPPCPLQSTPFLSQTP
jgi:hypothetical protein